VLVVREFAIHVFDAIYTDYNSLRLTLHYVLLTSTPYVANPTPARSLPPFSLSEVSRLYDSLYLEEPSVSHKT